MREIIFDETSTGLMEPRPTTAQRRKQRVLENEAQKKRRARDEIISCLIIAAVVIAFCVADLALFQWAISHRG